MKSTYLKKTFLALTLFVSFMANAQPEPEGNDDLETPISTYLIWLAITGFVMAFIFIKRYKIAEQ